MAATAEIAIRDSDKNTSALVLIHGFSGDAHTTYGMMPAFIAGDPESVGWDIFCFGYPTSLAPDVTGVWASDPDLTQLSAYFGQFIETRLARYARIMVIAHSMGGLIAQRAILDGKKLQKRLAGLMLFGTPSDGLKKAGLVKIFKQQVRDMGQDSGFLRALRHDRQMLFAKPPFTFDAVAGLSDQFVPPSSSLEPFDARFQYRVPGNHLEIVKPSRATDSSVALVLSRLRGTPVKPSRAYDPASATSVVERALALELLGRQDEAIALLSQHARSDTDVAGSLAGRYKRRWMRDPDEHAADGELATRYYTAALEEAAKAENHEQAYYNGINAAFMNLAWSDDRDAARAIAATVLAHTGRANGTKWCDATAAEAYLHLGEPDKSIALYQQALGGLDPRERASMCQQAIWTARLLEMPFVEAQIEALMLVGSR